MRKNQTFDDRVDVLCPLKGIEFTGDGFRMLCGPIVYLMLGKGETPLYIGMSRNGLSRTCDPKHGACEARSKCTSVLVYPCKDAKHAMQLEMFLIRKFNPEYNIQNKRVA
jgi:excinuclease UvrABC nuclease subunit